ncbi:MAG: hypothetical protein QXL94_00005, partial [Candidatus Parvarchaeum sp.]
MSKELPIIIGGMGIVGAILGIAYYEKTKQISPSSPPSTTSVTTSTAVPPVLVLTLSSSNITQGSPITISGALTMNGFPIPSATITLTGLGSPILSTTSSLGIAKKTVIIKSVGSYTITGKYSDSSGSTTSSVGVTVQRLNTINTVSLSSNGTAVIVGNSLTFTVSVTNIYNTPLPAIPIAIYLDGVLYSSITSNNSGTASIQLTFNELGTHTIYAKAGSIVSQTITVGVNNNIEVSLQVSTTGIAESTTEVSQEIGGNVFWIAKATGLENGGVAAGVPIHFAALSTTVVTGSTGIAIVENSYSVAG